MFAFRRKPNTSLSHQQDQGGDEQLTMLKHRVSNAGIHSTSQVNRNCSNSEITQNEMCRKTTMDQSGLHIQFAHSSTNVQDNSIEWNEEGFKQTTNTYDSIDNAMWSPQRSPGGSTESEGESFTFTDLVASRKFQEGVTEKDLLQVDTFYRSHKSEVYVCGCLANLYFCSVQSAFAGDQWVFSCTGIPLLLLDSGEHHRERKLHLILAEKGTGFTVWRETIGNHTKYKTPNVNFHTMYVSTDPTKSAGLSFDDAKAASEFYRIFQKLTADPNDELLKVGKSKKKSVKNDKKSIKLPKKTEISQPCCFVHVTKLDRPSMDTETTTDETKVNSSDISAPFNFQHLTASPAPGNSEHSISAHLSSMTGSKLTFTSTESVDSGLPEDRNSIRDGK